MKVPARAMEIFLQPGELWFGDSETRIRTILGSCVAVTLWHPSQCIGGMCHFMLPRRPPRGDDCGSLDGRYGDEALAMLVAEIHAAGTRTGEYEAKLFGGGRMFQSRASTLTVSDQNAAAARELAAHHGFRVTAQHMGGDGHRHVILDLWDGNTRLKHTPLQSAPPEPAPQPAPALVRQSPLLTCAA